MRFSQRTGRAPVRLELQRESIDQPLLNKLWSAIFLEFFAKLEARGYSASEPVTTRLWIHFFENQIDAKPHGDDFKSFVRTWYFDAEWFEVYDLVEALLEQASSSSQARTLTQTFNSFLESEMAAYRIIDGHVTGIVSAEEVQAVDDAIASAVPLKGVNTHLRAAVSLFSDRQAPDYRNSIKESISAVESLCQVITGNPKATLGQALKRLEDAGIEIHPALREGWSKLYGWTNDSGGIRHALAEGSSEPGSDEARYMLVTASAFVNYLISAAARVGVKL